MRNKGKKCNIAGCNRDAVKRHKCEMHYRRQLHDDAGAIKEAKYAHASR